MCIIGGFPVTPAPHVFFPLLKLTHTQLVILLRNQKKCKLIRFPVQETYSVIFTLKQIKLWEKERTPSFVPQVLDDRMYSNIWTRRKKEKNDKCGCLFAYVLLFALKKSFMCLISFLFEYFIFVSIFYLFIFVDYTKQPAKNGPNLKAISKEGFEK